jgi:hypothetical protein
MVGAQGLADQRGAKAVQQLKVAAEALQGLGWLAYAGPTSGECRVGQQWLHHGSWQRCV